MKIKSIKKINYNGDVYNLRIKDGNNINKEMKHKHTLLENEIARLKIIEEGYKECQILLKKCTGALR